MSRISRISVTLLACAVLMAMLGSPWGEVCHGQTSGSLSSDYRDQYDVKHRVVRQPYLDVEVWVDKGEGSSYHPGEEIQIYFEASRDCYVVIYNVDTRGYVHLLYPVDSEDDFYLEGERIYKIPDRFDDYQLTVDGPEGVEYVQAVASLEPLDLPNFPGEYEYEGQVYAYQLDGEDPFEFMADVNAEIAPYDYASDVCIFSVEYEHPQWYYHPQVTYVDRPVDVYWGGAYFGYPWGVELWIDGIYYGITPITIPWLVVGRHYVSFWYHGCWIWRDWCHIYRDRTIRIWGDCHDRYRYVRERFVEKSYRAEKAKRRRGTESTTGLVRPIRRTDKGLMASAEVKRIVKDIGYGTDESAKRRVPRDSFSPSQLGDKVKPRKTEKTIRSASVRESPRGIERRSIAKRKPKAERITSEVKTPRKKEEQRKVTGSKKASRTPQKIRSTEGSKPRAAKVTVKSPAKRTTKPSGSSTAKTTVKKPSTERPAKKRR